MTQFVSGAHQFHYWPVEQGKLIAGPSPICSESFHSKQFLAHLLSLGVRTFVSLQEEDEVARRPCAFYHDVLERLADDKGIQVSFLRMPIMDGTVPNDASIRLLLDALDSSIRDDRPVYVHCLAGHGRTGTLVGCWLARHGLSGSAALQKLKELRSDDPYLLTKPCPQKPAQTATIKRWIG